MRKELASYLVKYGNFSKEEAEEKAAKLLPLFLEGCNEFEMLGHKGLKWFAKEVCKKWV